jgi:hypothetical protein
MYSAHHKFIYKNTLQPAIHCAVAATKSMLATELCATVQVNWRVELASGAHGVCAKLSLANRF